MIRLSDKERRDIQERLVSLTRDLVLIPSIPSRPEDIRRCFEFIKNHVDYLGHIKVKEYERNGVISFLAVPQGCEAPDVLLCGHLDVVSQPDLSCYKSEIRDGRIYGPGAGDMKGSIAIMLEVFRKIHSSDKNASLGILITSDEESGGKDGVGYLVGEKVISCQEALIPDGGSLNKITVGEKGIIHLEVRVKGVSGHASRPWLSENPIPKLMAGLVELEKHFAAHHKNCPDNWYPTATITQLHTDNDTANRIPDEVRAVIDIRFPHPFSVREVHEEIKKIFDPIGSSEIIISAEPTEFVPQKLFFEMTEKITKEKALENRDHGGSDARFFSAHGIPVIISRPLVGNLHGEDEWIEIESMVQLYEIYLNYLQKKLFK